jgi:hypothetical protein
MQEYIYNCARFDQRHDIRASGQIEATTAATASKEGLALTSNSKLSGLGVCVEFSETGNLLPISGIKQEFFGHHLTLYYNY